MKNNINNRVDVEDADLAEQYVATLERIKELEDELSWNYDTNKLEEEVKRQAEIYIFSVLNHKDQNTVDPMNLDQWDFYVLPTKILNDKLPHQKTIGLQGLTKLTPYRSKFENLKNIIDDIKNSL